ncbi:hypothetical protein B0T26DRAFT_801986 [Lasiosphaeria miniovina]|uniref:Uncharacterized protein n=1 Tax=Lasiosphaeria miniovina TaxID=1954250 RepID=A0AA40AWW8_9PEZI|nr:uncharacterized protein B0T26DRAFT_801986 [Lasiosphaeria miniovina]KAK0723465.1 hypothetical protein B0T26DRAFT_801986 [Lasiosphaeria miniovina]
MPEPICEYGITGQVQDSDLVRLWNNFETQSSQIPQQSDNIPPPTNPYLSNLLPLSAHHPPLSQSSMFVATCMLGERVVMDRGTMIAARGNAIRTLHKMLSSPQSSTTDEAIAAVVKLVVNDLCYGETQHLRLHIDGVREMTRLRGGLTSLGMNGSLAKMVIVADMVTAIAMEMPPLYPEQETTDYTALLESAGERSFSSNTTTLQEAVSPQNSPSSSSAPFSSLEPSTAAVLSDVEFLVDTVLGLPQSPSPWELQKVQSMSAWVRNRVAAQTEHKSAAAMNLHRAVRLAGLAYCRAIQERHPLSGVVGEAEAADIVDAARMVSLEIWAGQLGPLLWILTAALPAARSSPRCHTGKNMVMAASLQMALDDWAAAAKALRRTVKLQAWLCAGEGRDENPAGQRSQ